MFHLRNLLLSLRIIRLLRNPMLALVVAAAAPAAMPAEPGLPPAVSFIASAGSVHEYRLTNGLRVLLVPNDKQATTTINMTYRVGSRMDDYDESGSAHLLEHMVSKGTPTHPMAQLEMGRRGIEFQATTQLDRTSYWFRHLSDEANLSWVLAWQADAMANSSFDQASLDTEKSVIQDEINRSEGSAGRALLRRAMALMYDWHNYGKSVLGLWPDVQNASITNLQRFYRRYYRPDNAVLIVAGKFNTEEVLRGVARYFEAVPRPEHSLEEGRTLDPAQEGERSAVIRRVAGAPLIYAGYHMPSGSHPDFVAAELLSDILGASPGGRLHRSLPPGLVDRTFGYAWGLADPSPMFVGVQPADIQKVELARRALLEVLDKVQSQPISEKEFNDAKGRWLGRWRRDSSDLEALVLHLSDASGLGDWKLFFLRRDQVEALTVGDVRRVARERMLRDNRSIVVYQPSPGNSGRVPAPERVDVPALLKGFRVATSESSDTQAESAPGQFDERTSVSVLPSGMRVGLLTAASPDRQAHAVLRVHYGDQRSPRGSEVIAGFVGALLDKGGAGLNRDQISARLQKLQAQLDIGANGEVLSVSMKAPSQNLPALISLVGGVLRRPSFPPAAFEELRGQWVAGIKRQRLDTESAIANLMRRHANPHSRGDLRYTPTFEEAADEVGKVTLGEVRSFHRRFYSAAHSEFAVVGSVEWPVVLQALQEQFGGWKQPAAGPAPFARVAHPFIAASPANLFLQMPEQRAALMRIEMPMPLNEIHEDYPAILMANSLFGEGTSSRLWRRLRERDGLSYQAEAQILSAYPDARSMWVVTATFAPHDRLRLEKAVREEVQRIRAEGFDPIELDSAKTGLLNMPAMSRVENEALAAQLANNLHHRRSFSSVRDTDQALQRLTLEQVNSAFKRYIDPDLWVAGWAGNFPLPPPGAR